MATTETPTQQLKAQQPQHNLKEDDSAECSTSLISASEGLSQKGSVSSSRLDAAASSIVDPTKTGPTPPSSPLESHSASQPGSLQDQADNETSDVRSLGLQQEQQPTPPSTLPEDAAFPHSSTGSEDSATSPVQQVEPDNTPSSSLGVTTAVRTDMDDLEPLDPSEVAFLVDADVDDTQIHEDTDNKTQATSESHTDQDIHTARTSISSVEAPSSSRSPPHSQDQPEMIRQNSNSRPDPLISFAPPSSTGDRSQYPYRYSSLLPSDASSFSPSRPSNLRRRSSGQNVPSTRQERRRQGSDIPLPVWQPDSEVNNCPICGNVFSFFYRKHHCRKCGRVVCSPCSPHRIVIPRSFVVSPPNTVGMSEDFIGTQASLMDSSLRDQSYGYTGDSGVEVRICEDCLAGENSQNRANALRLEGVPAVPQHPPPGIAGRYWTPDGGSAEGGNDLNSLTGRRRSRSNVHPSGFHGSTGFPGAPFHQHPTQFQGAGRPLPQGFPHIYQHPANALQPHLPPQAHPPNFSMPHTTRHQSHFPPSSHYSPHHSHQRSVSSNNAITVNAPIRGYIDTSQQPIPSFSMPEQRPYLPVPSDFMGQSTNSASRPRLKETDFCPICTLVLPAPNPVTGDETEREAHILECIQNAENASSREVARQQNEAPNQTPTALAAQSPPASTTPIGSPVPRPGFTAASSSSPQIERTRRNTATGRGGGRMVVYKAAEKDTFAFSNDAEAEGRKAECVICFEEFEEGDLIARLECFCRYHKKCIREWFDRKGNGECPVHAVHD